MRVLVIEDDRKVAGFIETGLTQKSYTVDVLHEGTRAGEQVHVVDYDAVVLDVMLPGRSGFEVLRDIRAEAVGGGPVPHRQRAACGNESTTCGHGGHRSSLGAVGSERAHSRASSEYSQFPWPFP